MSTSDQGGAPTPPTSIASDAGAAGPTEGPAATTPAPARGGGSGLATAALAAIVSLAGGLGGAYGYLHYLAQPGDANPRPTVEGSNHPAATSATPRASAAKAEARFAVATTSTRDPADQFKDLAEHVERLQKQVDVLASKTGPAPEVAALQVRISDLNDVANTLAPVPGRVDRLSQRVDEMSSTLATIRNELTALQSRHGATTRLASSGSTPRETLGSAPAPAPIPRSNQPVPPADEPTPIPNDRRPVSESTASDPSIARALSAAADLFRRGRYKEAREAFGRLELKDSEDARVWYYAALSYGLSTKDWTVGAERLVQKGISREEAGTPRRSEIDAEFKDLTSADGKDWLSAYRKRVKIDR